MPKKAGRNSLRHPMMFRCPRQKCQMIPSHSSKIIIMNNGPFVLLWWYLKIYQLKQATSPWLTFGLVLHRCLGYNRGPQLGLTHALSKAYFTECPGLHRSNIKGTWWESSSGSWRMAKSLVVQKQLPRLSNTNHSPFYCWPSVGEIWTVVLLLD